VLLGNLYSRFRSHPVRVITNERADAGLGLPIIEEVVDGRLRGLRDGAIRQHVRLARRLKREASRGAVVHCGRGIPEGIAALWSRLALRGPRFATWVYGEEVASAMLSREFSVMMRLVYRYADHMIACSAHSARLLASLGLPSGRISVVYPGVDCARFTPEVDGRQVRAKFAEPDDFVILSLGRLQTRKGHDMMLQAVAELGHRGRSVRYIVGGTGEDLDRLVRLAADLGVSARVAFVGLVGEDDLPAFYAACDLFALPNRVEKTDFEGFGIVFLEAAASGRPALAGNTGGAPEAVVDGETGFVVDPTSPGEIADTVCMLMDSPETRSRLGTQGRRRAVAEFTWARAALQVEAIHRDLAAG
jgi:phosphatidylinositol alpha-1,6-mannosyltransferase